MSGVVLGIPPATLDLIQRGLLERAFHDGLFPALQYRAEALVEQWEGNTGQEIFMSRPGLLTPIVEPLTPGNDPVPQSVSYEQWIARLDRFAGTVDTHLPTSATANANLFLRNIHQLGLQAGQSINRVPRNALFQAYLSGQTCSTVAGAAIDTLLKVAALNGFTEVVIPGTNVRPATVSPLNPLPITIFGVTGSRNVIGAIPDNPADPIGPGTLILSAALGAIVAVRSPVLSSAKPRVIRSGGGDSVDSIGAADTLVLQDIINAVSILRDANVAPHDDGWYHAHVAPLSNAQVFTDPAWQRLNTALPDHVYYKEAFLGTIAGMMAFMNTESPNTRNSGTLTATGTNAKYAKNIGAEVTNESNVNIGRVIVTGKGSIYERYYDESGYVSEAGLVGKVGEFQIVNQGIQVMTERIRLYLRAPQDRLGDVAAATWSISTCFPIPTDITSGGPERYKRAVVIEHAVLAR